MTFCLIPFIGNQDSVWFNATKTIWADAEKFGSKNPFNYAASLLLKDAALEC